MFYRKGTNRLPFRALGFVLPAIFLLFSCSPLTPISIPDPADAFVGEYNFIDKYTAVWGSDSRTFNSGGSFCLTKISKDQVKMTGAWTTIGTVVGNNISFGQDMASDADGLITYTFGVGTLLDDSLTFKYSGTGSLKYTDGRSYPCSLSGTVTARKKE